MARDIAVSAKAGVWALLDVEEGSSTESSPPWRAPAVGSFAYEIVHVSDALEAKSLVRVPQAEPSTLMNALTVSDGGLVLGPHADGAGLYDPEGAVVATYGAAPTKHEPPKGALSPNGRWIALTHDGGAIRIIDREGGERVVLGPLDQVLGLEATNDGRVYVRGFGPADWGLYVIDVSGGPKSIAGVHARLIPDTDTVVEAQYSRVSLRTASDDLAARTATRDSALPELGMARRGAAKLLDERTAIVRTDMHTLAEIDLSSLKKA